MIFKCVTGAKFNMVATVLSQGVTEPNVTNDGYWVERQNPDTGEIERVWVVDTDPVTPGDQIMEVPCMVKAVLGSGMGIAGQERINNDGVYQKLDSARMWFPANYVITDRDRVTNIKNQDGIVLWKEEEFDNAPTIFDVVGVAPITDPFGNLMEQVAILKRSEVQ